jgi:hypothetical protein
VWSAACLKFEGKAETLLLSHPELSTEKKHLEPPQGVVESIRTARTVKQSIE